METVRHYKHTDAVKLTDEQEQKKRLSETSLVSKLICTFSANVFYFKNKIRYQWRFLICNLSYTEIWPLNTNPNT